MICFFMFMLFKWGEAPIVFSDEIPDVFDIQAGRDSLFGLNPEECAVYKFDLSGKLLKEHQARGEGPGEFVNPIVLRLYRERVYVGDLLGKLVVFDQDLNFISEKKFGFLIRGMTIVDEGIYLVAHEPARNNTIIKMSHDYEPLAFFGTPVPVEHRNGTKNMGSVFCINQKIFFVHSFILGVEVFDMNGKKLGHSFLPGRDLESATMLRKKSWKTTYDEIIGRVEASPDGMLALWVRNNQEKAWSRYDFDSRDYTLRKHVGKSSYVFYLGGYPYSKTRDPDSDAVVLKPFKIDGG